MKANINLDREATIALLKILDIDIKKEIKEEFSKIIEREVKVYCDELLNKTMNKWTREGAYKKIIQEAVECVRNNAEGQISRLQNDINDEMKEYRIIAIDKIKRFVNTFEIPPVTEGFIQKTIQDEVRQYLDLRFKR